MIDPVKRKGFPNNVYSVVGLVLVTMLVSLTGTRLVSSFSLNLAHTVLNKALWQGKQAALERQQMLSLAATLLQISTGEELDSSVRAASDGQCDMIPSMIIAEYYRRQRNVRATAFWLHRAATADPYPAIQDTVAIPAWAYVTPQGDIVLDWSTADWYFRSDSQPADLAFDDENGWLNISYDNKLGHRDIVIYAWRGPLEIRYWHTLHLRARVHPGTFLTFATHSIEGVERHVSYHRGTGEWKVFTIPLDVDSIRFIYIALREPSSDPDTPHYAIDIEPLTLLLDDAAGKCEP